MRSIRFQALRDLLGRYLEIWRDAWRHRVENTPPHRLPHETHFLPAALALQETPISPAPRVAMWMLVAFMVIALLWSILGRIDVVATAQGKIVPSGRTKLIQPMQTATVKAIHVSDGKSVKAGELLIELDPTLADADRVRVRSELAGARLLVARSRAMLGTFEGKPALALQRPADVSDSALLEARHLLAGQQAEYQARLARIEAEMARRQAELVSTRALAAKLEKTVPIARQRAQDLRNLVDQSFVSKHGYLEREQVRIEQEGDLANLHGRLKEIEAALHEARSQKTELATQTRRATLDNLTEGLQRQTAMEQELAKAVLQSELTQLRSPVDGVVQQLDVHTVGGVVTPAQQLMLVVPHEQSLEVEAFLENKDIGFVTAGQVAAIKVETFQFTKYGTVGAKVMSVSHDAISDEKRGLIYSSRILMEKATVMVDGNPVRLAPGMAVSAEIKTGQRRVIEYFLSPLITYASESLRER